MCVLGRQQAVSAGQWEKFFGALLMSMSALCMEKMQHVRDKWVMLGPAWSQGLLSSLPSSATDLLDDFGGFVSPDIWYSLPEVPFKKAVGFSVSTVSHRSLRQQLNSITSLVLCLASGNNCLGVPSCLQTDKTLLIQMCMVRHSNCSTEMFELHRP